MWLPIDIKTVFEVHGHKFKVRSIHEAVIFPPAAFSCIIAGVECGELNLIMILPTNYKEKMKWGKELWGTINGVIVMTDHRISPS